MRVQQKYPANPWLSISQPNPEARLRLFCFPYAGGAASFYRAWHHDLPATVDVCAIQLPGREQRIRERPFTDMGTLVATLVPILRPYLDQPFAFFGHSMGALIAYEVAQQIQQQYGQAPTHLFVSGRRAPMLPEVDTLLHTLPSDDLFLHELQQRYNNLPALLLTNQELRALFTPLLRADFTLVETYSNPMPTRLSCPLIALGGTEDPRASQADLHAWQSLTTADFALHTYPGAHFYLNEQRAPLLATIARYLA